MIYLVENTVLNFAVLRHLNFMMKKGEKFKNLFPKLTENKKSNKTTSWYTHPQSGSIEGQGQTEKVKATEESHSGAVNNGKKPKKVQPADTEEYKVRLYRNHHDPTVITIITVEFFFIFKNLLFHEECN